MSKYYVSFMYNYTKSSRFVDAAVFTFKKKSKKFNLVTLEFLKEDIKKYLFEEFEISILKNEDIKILSWNKLED